MTIQTSFRSERRNDDPVSQTTQTTTGAMISASAALSDPDEALRTPANDNVIRDDGGNEELYAWNRDVPHAARGRSPLNAPAVPSENAIHGVTKEEFVDFMNDADPRPDGDFIDGLWDGFKSQLEDLGGAAQLAWDLLDESTRREFIAAGEQVYEMLQQGRGLELLELVGEEALGDLKDAVVNFSDNPWYYSGYLAGGLAAGGLLSKLARLAKVVTGAQRVLDRMNGRRRSRQPEGRSNESHDNGWRPETEERLGANWDTDRSRPATTHTPRIPTINNRRPINYKYANQTYRLSGPLGGKYPHGVPFSKQGFPDFTRYAIKTQTIELTGDRVKDGKLAEEMLSKLNPEWSRNIDLSQYTWHHHHEVSQRPGGRFVGKMQLIPRDVHDAVRHTGGAAVSPFDY